MKKNNVIGSWEGFDFVHLENVPYEEFKIFLESLTDENETWNLDLQWMKDDKHYYDQHVRDVVTFDGDDIIALFSHSVDIDTYPGHELHNPKGKANIVKNWYYAHFGLHEDIPKDAGIVGCIYSYVVKKSHWGRGIGRSGLQFYMSCVHITMMEQEKLHNDVRAKALGSKYFGFKINELLHLARTHIHNIGSRSVLRNIGYIPVWRDDDQIIYSLRIDCTDKDISKHVPLQPPGKLINWKSKYDMDADLIAMKREKKIQRIQFIITGWHFNQDSLIEGLSELEQENEVIDVFWACHREPPERIKRSFDYKVFHNGGEECGAYDQAINHLDLDDTTICFFMHDDLIIKDWSFINESLQKLGEYKIVGNGRDYADNFNPFEVTKIGISEEFDGKTFKDYVKPENQHLFDEKMAILKVRPSFICMRYKHVKDIGGFEPREEALISPITEKDEWNSDGEPHYRGTKGLGSYGNLFPALVCYKMNKVLGSNSITYLSDRYLDSDYIYELGRGEIDPNNPIT